MAYRVDDQITVHAPPAVVWNTVQDPHQRLRWDARIADIEVLTAGPIGRGTRTLLRYGMARLAIEIELIAWVPCVRSGVRGRILATGDALAGSWRFAPAPGGGTTWSTTVVLRGRGRLGWLREQVAGRVVGALTRASLRNLKRLVEAQVPARAAA